MSAYVPFLKASTTSPLGASRVPKVANAYNRGETLLPPGAVQPCPMKTIACLANSRKLLGRCVAGN